MADIELQCSRCAKSITLSEFADLQNVFCRACGAKMESTATSAPRSVTSGLRLKTQPAQDAAAPLMTEKGESLTEFTDRTKRDAVSRRPRSPVGLIGSWVVFIVLGGIMALLRYGDIVESPWVMRAFSYGPFVIIAFHILITLRAFKESVFSGILCILVPGYSLYYLFMVSDDFYLRAILAGLLAGIGHDSALYFQRHITAAIDAVQRYIASGG